MAVDSNQDHPQEALDYLNALVFSARTSIASNQIDYLIELIKNDMESQPFPTFREYLNSIFSKIPAKILPEFLELLIKLRKPYWFLQRLINFLIDAKRPIYQIKALQLIQKVKDDSYIPLVVPLIYHAHPPLRKEAILTIKANPGCAEKMLESDIKSRSEKKRSIAKKVLRQINPENLRLALEMIDSQDFLERIHSIQTLAKTHNRKWISKITALLNDPDLAVRKAAIEAISHLGGKKAKKILNQKLLHEDYLPLRSIIQEQLENF
jgi:hypothetical protein